MLEDKDGTLLDAELLSLNQTLGELINMGLAEEIFYPEEGGNGPIRFRLTPAASAIVEVYAGEEMRA